MTTFMLRCSRQRMAVDEAASEAKIAPLSGENQLLCFTLLLGTVRQEFSFPSVLGDPK
jgi:hypothetical protein